MRASLTILLLAFVSLAAQAADRKVQVPVVLEVSPAPRGLPLVTLTAVDAPLNDIAKRLVDELGVPVDVSAPARELRVTTKLARQPLDLMLRELAPQAWLDGVLSGGSGAVEIRTIYLRTAGEEPPSLKKLETRSSDVVMFLGHTEDESFDPLEGKIDVTYRNDRLRIVARKQLLAVVAARIADALGIPLELIGDSLEVVDVAVTDASIEQAMIALSPSVKLYQRLDLATYRVTPVRLVVEAPAASGPPGR